MTALQVKMAVMGRLDRYDEALARVHTGAVRAAVDRIRKQGRRQIATAGLGRLARAWRGMVLAEDGRNLTRRGTDLNPRGRVYSSAGVKGRVDDLLAIFEEGVVLVPKHGTYFAIPTALAGGRRARPAGSYPEGTFRLVPVGRRGRRRGARRKVEWVLVHKGTSEVWYLLIALVRLRRRLRLLSLIQRQASRVPADVDRRWARAVRRLEASV